jgi:hypothetical protein
MRSFLTAALVLVGLGSIATEASAGCNVRGEFCGYPNWASNVFAGRKKVPESTLPPDEPYRVYAPYRSKPYVRGYRYR